MEDSSGVITICGYTNVRYTARVRWPGCQRYELVGRESRSKRVALHRLAEAFATGKYKRGDVIMTADYYDPHQICEIVRR